MIATSSRKDDALDRLTDGIAQLTNSDAWRAWLSVQARFHTYSFSNTVLILTQHPTATRVADFATWRRLGRVVRRGEHAIWKWGVAVSRPFLTLIRHVTAEWRHQRAQPIRSCRSERSAWRGSLQRRALGERAGREAKRNGRSRSHSRCRRDSARLCETSIPKWLLPLLVLRHILLAFDTDEAGIA